MDKDELRLREIGYEKGLEEAHARGYDGEFAEILALQYMDEGYIEEYEKTKLMYANTHEVQL